MYAKKTGRLQERLDVYWIVHEASKTEHERRIFLERKLASTRPMILINFL